MGDALMRRDWRTRRKESRTLDNSFERVTAPTQGKVGHVSELQHPQGTRRDIRVSGQIRFRSFGS